MSYVQKASASTCAHRMRSRMVSGYIVGWTSVGGRRLSRNNAFGINGERSRLGCCSARPRAEHPRECTHQTVHGFTRTEWAARARPTAPEAGALPVAIVLFRLRIVTV